MFQDPSSEFPLRGATAPTTDSDMAAAAARGEKRAFVEIVARHQAMVCGVTLGVLGDFSASEDAAQEAFIAAWRKIRDLRETDKLRPWLAQIARNAALDQLRRSRSRQAGEPLEYEPVTDPAATPDQSAVSGEETALVRAALEKLPENYRLPLVLFYRQDQSVKEVADTLGLSEDAVKQRLARGREMLRERMSGLVETALRHTMPGAVFTITVAAAIGALASPAAVAGTAFAASAATAAASTSAVTAGSTTSTATTPVVTAMTTSKLSLTTAALVASACLPLGYAVHYATEKTPPPATAESGREAGVTNAPRAKPDFNDSVLFAEWMRLHEEHGHDAAAMPALFKAISEVKDPFRRRAFRAALVAEWGQVDPAGGLDFFLQKGADGNARRQIFREWLARDPKAAMAKLKTAGKAGDSLAAEVLTDIAKAAPEEIPAIAARLPESDDYWNHPVADAFAILAEKNLDMARAAAESLAGPRRGEALEGVAKAWAKTDMDAVITWTATLPEGADRDAVLRSALIGLASVDAEAALSKANIVPPGGRPNYFADTTSARLLRELGEKEFDTVTRWLRDNPGKIPGSDLIGLAEATGRRLNADPAAFLDRQLAEGTLGTIHEALHSALLNDSKPQLGRVWEWLRAHQDDPAAFALRKTVISCSGWQNPELALTIAKDLPPAPEGDTTLRDIAQSLLNGGRRLGGLEPLLEKAPEQLRGPLISSAFSLLTAETLDAPERWLPRFAAIPEEDRVMAATSLATAWAGQNPEAAAQWVAGLSAEGGRSQALRGVAEAWVKRDSLGASEWIAQLQPGPDRDAGAGMLVNEIHGDSPDEAWEWAVSISDAALRGEAAVKTLGRLAERDPGEALRRIDQSSLADAEKQALRAKLHGVVPAGQ